LVEVKLQATQFHEEQSKLRAAGTNTCTKGRRWRMTTICMRLPRLALS